MSCALDVLFVGTCLLEEVNDSLNTLLGELLVALCGTGLLVSITIDDELGVLVDNVVGEVLEVSLFTCAEGSGTTVEVESDRCTCGSVNSGEVTIFVEVGLAVYELTERSNFLLEFSNFVLELCILLLEFCNLTGEVFILLGGEGHGNNCRNNACAALEAALTDLVSNTPGEGEREGNLCRETSTRVIPVVTILISNCKCASVDDHIELLIAKECILLSHDTGTESPTGVGFGSAIVSVICNADASRRISNPAPVASLLIAVDEAGEIEQDIKTCIVLPEAETIVGDTVVADTETVLGSEPLTNKNIKTKTGQGEDRKSTTITSVDTIVSTNASTNKPVVAESVGLVRSANDVAVCVTIRILLSVSAH